MREGTMIEIHYGFIFCEKYSSAPWRMLKIYCEKMIRNKKLLAWRQSTKPPWKWNHFSNYNKILFPQRTQDCCWYFYNYSSCSLNCYNLACSHPQKVEVTSPSCFTTPGLYWNKHHMNCHLLVVLFSSSSKSTKNIFQFCFCLGSSLAAQMGIQSVAQGKNSSDGRKEPERLIP